MIQKVWDLSRNCMTNKSSTVLLQAVWAMGTTDLL
jgi:hypothetical protein